ncbi:MAG: PfkB family carbohydrate kinase [Candidatus Omnitrophica bacterium]|nr:PfkB family carbohydrate kinase [Candidatus Omnitrophota bacterium]
MDVGTEKILVLDELVNKVRALKKRGKVVVQSHGVFDLIHPGVIKHLKSAKEQGDILIVSVIRDKDVHKGPGRPIFPESLRAQNVACLSMVDYVCVVNDEKPFESVKIVNPDIFAKGHSIKDYGKDIHNRIFEEEKELYFGKIRILEAEGFSFDSSDIIKNLLNIYPKDVSLYLKAISRIYSFEKIAQKISSLQKLKVLIIGDGIIDEYHYCETLGKAAKFPLVVNRYLTHEVFAGGAFAVANHVGGLCDDVQLVTLLGLDSQREGFIHANARPNIKQKFFYRENGSTIVKKRYINQYLNQKLFEVNYLNDSYIDGGLESQIIEYLKTTIPSYDLVLVSDYGHGFITRKMIKLIEESAVKFAVNTQTNAANAGYNMITKYKKPYYICLDESELRWAAQEKFAEIEDVARQILKSVKPRSLIVTLGRRGSLGINIKGQVVKTPVFSTKVIDTVGAGDAFFAFTAPCLAKDFPLDLVSFIGNAVGALAVQIVGNKKPVEKYEFLEFVHALLK